MTQPEPTPAPPAGPAAAAPSEETTADRAQTPIAHRGRFRLSRRRLRIPEPTAADLAGLPVKDRLDLLNQQRQARHLTWNSIGILFGVAFTAASLIATAMTVRTTQEDLRTTKEGQITDRYTKAVEQLGSDKREVRTAAIYALERIARDSDRDRLAIINFLAAYVREHDPKPSVKNDELPSEPDIDVAAALTAIGRLPHSPNDQLITPYTPDLHAIRLPGSQLLFANLSGANLRRANLRRADLRGADLRGADLRGADLTDTDLYRANLIDADLHTARLYGADLRGMRGLTPAQLAKVAITDQTTLFS